VDIELGRFAAQVERPEPIKFAWPIVLFPELFTTSRHLAVMLGYFATIGWEVYAPDLRSVAGKDGAPELGALRFKDLRTMASEAIAAIGREVIVAGHGLGGLLAMSMATEPQIKAAVAIAPMIPGLRSSLVSGIGNRLALWRERPLSPPSGRTLFDFVADAESFQRDVMIAAMIPDAGPAAIDVVHGAVELPEASSGAPRLIIAGESDPFAPFDRVSSMADKISAKIVKIAGRGHWLIGGRALERAINEMQRFLVRALGQDLLLLFPEEWKER
jgi:pimeloyl-ACP methyl ester carboxylesterase